MQKMLGGFSGAKHAFKAADNQSGKRVGRPCGIIVINSCQDLGGGASPDWLQATGVSYTAGLYGP